MIKNKFFNLHDHDDYNCTYLVPYARTLSYYKTAQLRHLDIHSDCQRYIIDIAYSVHYLRILG